MKKVVRVSLVVIGVGVIGFLLFGLPLLTHSWLFTIMIGGLFAVFGLLWLIEWAWSE